ncbi:MAG: hypothetical protein AB3N64_13430 [Puniceicoccaceae bacterium]
MKAANLRSDIDEVMDRIIRFSTNGRVGEALVMVDASFGSDRKNIKGLDQWRFPEEMEAYLEQSIQSLEETWARRTGIADDLIPAGYAWYGIAEHSAFVAGEVGFGTDTSWPHPVLNDYADLDKLKLDEDNIWLRMVIDGMKYLQERSEGRFAVKLRGAMAPMDLANALRGNDLFLDIYENPDELHALLRFCVEAGKWFTSRQSQAIDTFHGGYISGTDIWMPGNAFGHLSEDASVMCSAETYREFGKPYTEALLEPFDRAFMHLHTAGVQAFEAVTELDKLQFFELAPDPKQPRGVEVYRNHFDLFKDSVMKLFITFDEIKENIAFLKQAKTALVVDTSSAEEAQAVVDFVRQEFPIDE